MITNIRPYVRIFKAPIQDRGLIFFSAYSSYIRASILQIFRPSVCMLGYKRQKCKTMNFLVPIKDRVLIFSLHIPLIYEHLFCKFFVRRSVGQATKDRNVKICKRDFLVHYLR